MMELHVAHLRNHLIPKEETVRPISMYELYTHQISIYFDFSNPVVSHVIILFFSALLIAHLSMYNAYIYLKHPQ